MMEHHARRLPHWNVIGKPLFVTFRLWGRLPANRVFPPDTLNAGKAFVAMDRILDKAQTGPLFLKIPEIAHCVVEAIKEGESRFRRYDLHSYVVMANRVPMLVTPHVVSQKWLGPLKGFTSHQANQILGRTGSHVWQDESYDHLVRNGEEFRRIQHYIESNPVKAGLVSAPGEIPLVQPSRLKGGCSQDWLPHSYLLHYCVE